MIDRKKPSVHAKHYERWKREKAEREGVGANGKPTSPVLCVAEDCPSPPFVARQWGSGPGEPNVHESQPEQHVTTPQGPMHFACFHRLRQEALRERGLLV